jgi:hypothetical protein
MSYLPRYPGRRHFWTYNGNGTSTTAAACETRTCQTA